MAKPGRTFGLPPGWDSASLRSFFGKMGGVDMSQCMKKIDGHVSDPGAFCNALQKRATGHPNKPGATKSLDDNAPPMLLTDVMPETEGLLARGVYALEYDETTDSVKELSLEAFGEKCMDMGSSMPAVPDYSWRPLGNAKSFAEADAFETATKFQHEATELQYQFSAIVDNIMRDDMMNLATKAAAVAAASAEMGQRIDNLPQEVAQEKSVEADSEKAGRRLQGRQYAGLKDLFDGFKKFIAWAGYEDKDIEKDDEKSLEAFADSISGDETVGFKVIREKDGSPRWVSFSANAYKDLESEIFSTKALTDAVDHADQTGERGPLLLYHVSSAQIGDADTQAMIGRFLFESGTFRNDELGQKALAYFDANPDENFGVSIGFKYRKGDERDGVYDWIRIVERSVTPDGKQANPWTAFVLGGKEMAIDKNKKEMLEKVFGSATAERLIATAESATKELDEAIAFKSKSDAEGEKAKDPFAELSSFVDSLGDGTVKTKLSSLIEKAKGSASKEADTKDGKKEDETDSGTKDGEGDSADTEAASGIAAILEPLFEQMKQTGEILKSMQETVAGLDGEVKALKLSDDEKLAARMAPRGAGFMASQSSGNTLEEEKAKELLNIKDGDARQPTNPAAAYVQDWLGIKEEVTA